MRSILKIKYFVSINYNFSYYVNIYNTSRTRVILFTISKLANIELQNVIIQNNSWWPNIAVMI